MDNLTELIQTTVGLSPETQIKILTSVIVILVLLLFRTVVLRIVWRRIEDVRSRYIWQKTLTYVVIVLISLLVGRVWFKGFHSLATYLGLLSAGLAIALKDPVASIAGWFFIMLRRPFGVGDRIQIGNYAGDVIDISAFQFALLEIGNWVDADQSTGRVVHVPNGKVFSETIANYSKGFQYIWNEIPVLITFESNWKKAKNILQDISDRHAEHHSKTAKKKIKEASKKFMIFYSKLTPAVYTSIEDSGILLTIRYLCKPRHRRNSEEAILEDILQEFEKCTDIDFAYPTQRFYNYQPKGKTKHKNKKTPESSAN
ncbi:MAG: mechanosensitive ion channel family protein [Candidatus Methanofastidiosia archaeon]